jgi:type IV secretory pathway VirB3-like protein
VYINLGFLVTVVPLLILLLYISCASDHESMEYVNRGMRDPSHNEMFWDFATYISSLST